MTSILKVMGPTDGDKRLEWDPENEHSIVLAKDMFEKALKEGKRAYRITNGRKGQPITEFDPNAKEILLVPPVAGG